jgi:hypothetical protein
MVFLSLVIVTLLVVLTTVPARGQLDRLLKEAPGLGGGAAGTGGATRGGLSDSQIAAGLKEALRVGTGTTVDLTGQLDGYLKNEAIKILLPENLRSMERGLRAIGLGSRVDEFVVSMNRAAENAAPQARQIFVDAITGMTFDDARTILSGGDTAATEFFKTKTTDKLTAAFAPIVSRSMDQVGATRQYKELVGRARSLPFVKTESLDLDRYVVGKSLDGLFHVLAQQEQQIRTNPAARTTDLLKQVFAAR